MLLNPVHKCVACKIAGGKIQHDALLLIDGRTKFIAIDYEESFHRCMPNSLVAIDERVIEDKRKAQGCGSSLKVGVEVLSGKALARLGKGRFQSAEVPNSAGTTPPFDYGPVEF